MRALPRLFCSWGAAGGRAPPSPSPPACTPTTHVQGWCRCVVTGGWKAGSVSLDIRQPVQYCTSRKKPLFEFCLPRARVGAGAGVCTVPRLRSPAEPTFAGSQEACFAGRRLRMRHRAHPPPPPLARYAQALGTRVRPACVLGFVAVPPSPVAFAPRGGVGRPSPGGPVQPSLPAKPLTRGTPAPPSRVQPSRTPFRTWPPPAAGAQALTAHSPARARQPGFCCYPATPVPRAAPNHRRVFTDAAAPPATPPAAAYLPPCATSPPGPFSATPRALPADPCTPARLRCSQGSGLLSGWHCP
jgi:hypothetical protein